MRPVLKFLCFTIALSLSSNVFSWPCEGPCDDSYTKVYATSPASGGSYSTGSTVRFTTNVERTQMSTYLPFHTQVSTSGGSGWSTSIISPSAHCLYGPYAELSCSNPKSGDVDMIIDVTVGTGTTRVTVRLDNDLGGMYISPEFYFDVTGVGAVKISGFSDMEETWSGSGASSDNQNICVYNSSSGTYDLDVSAPTDSGDFVLENGSNKLPITIYWNDETGTTGRSTLNTTSDPSLSGATGANTSSTTCGGGSNSNISWSVSESDLLSVPAGTYSATLSVEVSNP